MLYEPFIILYSITVTIIILLIIAKIITNSLFCPPWYENHKNSTKLCKETPELWELKSKKKDPKSEYNLDFETVEFCCGPIALSGNKKLRGWLIPSPYYPESKDLCIVVCHGGARDRRQHLRHVPALQGLNKNASVLLFDSQEHGLSDGKNRGLGWFTYEGSDAYAACEYAKEIRQFNKVIAMGTSFGGAAVLIAAGYFDRAKKKYIDAVISENPPHSRFRLIEHVVHSHLSHFLSSRFLSTLIACLCCLIMQYQQEVSLPNPQDVIAQISPRPLLITHGFDDVTVPFDQGMDLYNAALSPKDCLWVENCDHVMIYNVDPIGWSNKVDSIIKSVMKS